MASFAALAVSLVPQPPLAPNAAGDPSTGSHTLMCPPAAPWAERAGRPPPTSHELFDSFDKDRVHLAASGAQAGCICVLGLGDLFCRITMPQGKKAKQKKVLKPVELNTFQNRRPTANACSVSEKLRATEMLVRTNSI